MKVHAAFVSVAVAIMLLIPCCTYADAPHSVNGVTVNPAIQNITLTPSQPTPTFRVRLENDTAAPVDVVITASDFMANGANGAIELKPNGDHNHGLASNFSFTPNLVSLAPESNTSVVVALRDTNTLAPGGHFAVIRYHVQPKLSTSNPTVNLRSELSTFVFLTTPGTATYGVNLKASLPAVAWLSLPTSTELVFTNNANTQAAPRGYVNISGPFHGQYAHGLINPDSSLVLPGSTRLYTATLHSTKTALSVGRYQTDIYYRAEPTAPYQHARYTSFYIGWLAIVVALTFVFGLLIVVSILQKKHRKRPAMATNVKSSSKHKNIEVTQL